MDSLLLFHAIAARRGDGLLPELVALIEKTKAARGFNAPRYPVGPQLSVAAERALSVRPNASKK
jgi:hypothetical protein